MKEAMGYLTLSELLHVTLTRNDFTDFQRKEDGLTRLLDNNTRQMWVLELHIIMLNKVLGDADILSSFILRKEGLFGGRIRQFGNSETWLCLSAMIDGHFEAA